MGIPRESCFLAEEQEGRKSAGADSWGIQAPRNVYSTRVIAPGRHYCARLHLVACSGAGLALPPGELKVAEKPRDRLG